MGFPTILIKPCQEIEENGNFQMTLKYAQNLSVEAIDCPGSTS
jgi:hypothetical protein